MRKLRKFSVLGGMAKLRLFERISFSLFEMRRFEKLKTTSSGLIELGFSVLNEDGKSCGLECADFGSVSLDSHVDMFEPKPSVHTVSKRIVYFCRPSHRWLTLLAYCTEFLTSVPALKTFTLNLKLFRKLFNLSDFGHLIRRFLDNVFEPKPTVHMVPKKIVYFCLPFTGSHSCQIRNQITRLCNAAYPHLNIRFVFRSFRFFLFF